MVMTGCGWRRWGTKADSQQKNTHPKYYNRAFPFPSLPSIPPSFPSSSLTDLLKMSMFAGKAPRVLVFHALSVITVALPPPPPPPVPPSSSLPPPPRVFSPSSMKAAERRVRWTAAVREEEREVGADEGGRNALVKVVVRMKSRARRMKTDVG